MLARQRTRLGLIYNAHVDTRLRRNTSIHVASTQSATKLADTKAKSKALLRRLLSLLLLCLLLRLNTWLMITR